MGDRQISISITSGTVVKTLLILGLAWLVYTLSDLVMVMLTAIVIASGLEPASQWFAKRHVPRVAAVLIVYLTFFAVFFGMFYFFLPPVLAETAGFVSAIPQYMDSFQPSFDQTSILGGGDALSLDEIAAQVRALLNNITNDAFSTASAVFGGVFSFVLILVFSFYFAVQERGIEDFLRIVVPRSHESYVLGLWKRAQKKIGLWMQGQLLLGLIVGILTYLGLMVLGVQYALVLAVLAGLFEIIPVFGPTLSAIPAVMIAFVDGGVTLGFLVIALYIIIQQFENHLIYPLVVTKVVGVPPLIVILALIIGAKLAGFLGILLAVPIAAALQEFVKDLESSKVVLDRKEA